MSQTASDAESEPNARLDNDNLPEDQTPDVEEYYGNLRDYVRMVARGHTNALMLHSPAGIGKSYQISTTLKEELPRDDIITQSGYCTPLELFHSLHEAREGKVLFLDDTEGVLSNKNALALLKQATWGEGDSEARYVQWQSSSGQLECDEKFEFNGRIIICVNDTPSDPIFRSLKSRCLPYELEFTYEERCEIIKEVAKAPYEGLSLEERQEVAEWIVEYSEPETEGVDLRTLIHCFDLYSYNQENWRELATDLLEVDEDKELVRKLLEKHDTVGDAVDEFKEQTGKSRRSFYRYKKDIQ